MPTRNRAQLLSTALRRVLELPVARVVVIDNASTDHTRTVVECVRDPRVVYIREEKNTGCAGALHAGMSYALRNNAGAVWVLDDDLFVDPPACVPVLAQVDESEALILIPTLTWRGREGHATEQLAGRAVVPNHLPLTGGIITRRAIERLGLPLGRFRNGAEDTEYILRARRMGVPVRLAEMSIGTHPHPRYVCIQRGRRTYYREVQPLWRLYSTTRNTMYMYLRYPEEGRFLVSVWRDVCGVLALSARLYPDSAWKARGLVVWGALVGMAAGVGGWLENRP